MFFYSCLVCICHIIIKGYLLTYLLTWKIISCDDLQLFISIFTILTIHHSFSLLLHTQSSLTVNCWYTAFIDYWTPYRIFSSLTFLFSSLFVTVIFCLVPCGRLSQLFIGFWAHFKIFWLYIANVYIYTHRQHQLNLTTVKEIDCEKAVGRQQMFLLC